MMKPIWTRDRSYYRSLITLALPVAAQSLIAFLATFADNLMVSSLGDASVSGVYFAGQINTFVQMFTSGVCGVILILSAQYWGRKDTTTIRSIVAIGVRLSFAVGFTICAICFFFPGMVIRVFTSDAAVAREGVAYLRIVSLSYLFFCITEALLSAMRAVETTTVGMTISLISLGLNVSCNALFIFVLKWGVLGAGLATLIGRMAETVAIGIYVLVVDKKLSLRLSDLKLRSRVLFRDYVRYGMPLIAGEIVWGLNMLFHSMIYGHFFNAAVATGVSIANTMNTLAYIVIWGLATAVGIITGKTVGAGKTELMREYARTTQALFLLVGLFSGALVACLNAPFVSLYRSGVSPEAAQEAARMIGVLCVTIIGTSYQMPCLFGLVKSGGDVSFVFRNDTIFVFLVVLPSAYISARLGAPAWWVFACLKSDQILKCIVAFVKVNRYNWMKSLTHAE